MLKNIVLIIALIFALPVSAKQSEEKKGHGAGGVRDENASEMGLEKGKAWAGSKEKKIKREAGEEKEKEKKPKKDKKVKKAKKSK